MLHLIKKYFPALVPKPLEELIADELRHYVESSLRARRVIRSHEFQLHMDLANINAMQEWLKASERSTEHVSY